MTVMGDARMDGLSDAGSTPAASTILIAGRTPECEIIVLRYGFWLALDLTVQV